MQPTDATRFQNLIRGMGRIFGSEPDGIVLDAYWLALKDWPLAEVEEAAAHLMRSSQFMPRPADFMALRKAGRPTAGEAWLEVLEYVRKGFSRWDDRSVSEHGRVQRPDSPVIEKAVAALGGYQAIAMSPTDKTVFLERRFAEHFEAMQDAEEIRDAVPLIAERGRAEGVAKLKQLLEAKGLLERGKH